MGGNPRKHAEMGGKLAYWVRNLKPEGGTLWGPNQIPPAAIPADCPVGWVNMGIPLLQSPRNLFMDSRNMPEKHRRIPIMGSATVSLLKIAIFTTYGMK